MTFLVRAVLLSALSLGFASTAFSIYDDKSPEQNSPLSAFAKVNPNRTLKMTNSQATPADVSESCEFKTSPNRFSQKCSLTVKQIAPKSSVEISSKDILVFESIVNNEVLLKSAKGVRAVLICSELSNLRVSTWTPKVLTPVELNRCFNEDRNRRDRPKIFSRNPDESAYEYKGEEKPVAQ